MTEIVAEISCNHGGKLDNAVALIHEAAKAGADAVKFQCFKPERVIGRRKDNPLIKELMKAHDGSYADLVLKNCTPWHWFPTMIEQAALAGINWFSSVFDPLDVAFLETLDCPRYKISAFEQFAWDIHRAVDATGKPKIVSVRPMPGVTILHATHYNGAVEPLGLSAHGVMLPASDCPMVEYHLMLPGVLTADQKFSLTPTQLTDVSQIIRRTRV